MKNLLVSVKQKHKKGAFLLLLFVAFLIIDLPYMHARSLCRKIEAGEPIEVRRTVGLAHPGLIMLLPGYPEYNLYISPLYEACKQQDVDAVQQLLENGADPNLSILVAETPLEILPRHHGVTENYLAILHLMIEYGADPTYGHYGNPFENLMIRLDGGEKSKLAEQAILYLLDQRENIASNRCLLYAAKGSSDAVVGALLVQDGIDVNAQISQFYNGRTPLMMAVNSSMESRYAIAELLVSHGADLSLCDESGNTAMDYAISKDDSKMVELLLREENIHSER